ncbi:hypothetical protein POSPLADRAFT_1136715 [Postia placenta MAD-698-R-SB12]|uniref:Uncharacterized protein n=1 Tax=Postia placenta MAD-698-R-SB12 TaxID=670580 RepID=A0A1X6N7M0_9APHY|nr:hypothetical protein POSPLADRAFT_1136715 [Postia placenta MAD-698-R-SB12]OSX64403.1 hypothetical protein POSPLADRAFT_1136715 [Postia placenta MAD-698-R-SB12]
MSINGQRGGNPRSPRIDVALLIESAFAVFMHIVFVPIEPIWGRVLRGIRVEDEGLPLLELQVFRLRGSWVAQTDSTSSIFSIHWVGIDYDGEEDEDIINSRLDHFGFITTFPNTQHLSIKSVSYQLYPSDWRHILRTMPCAISMELHDTASLALAEALRPARVAEDSHDELGHSGIGVAQDVLIHYAKDAEVRTLKTFLESMRDITAETSFVGNSFDWHYVEAGTSRATKQNSAKDGYILCSS